MKFFGNFLAKERRNRAESSRKLRLEALENRELLSADGITPLVTTATSDATQLVVTTLDDVVDPNDGVISLREAIATAVDNVSRTQSRYYNNNHVTFDPSLTGKITLNSPINIAFNQNSGSRSITVDGVVGNNAKIEIAGQFNITGNQDDYTSSNLSSVTFTNIAFVGDGSNVSDYVFYKSRVVNLTVQNSIIQHYDLSVGVVSSENRASSTYGSVESIRFINSVIYKNNFTTSQAQVVNTWYTANGTYRPTTGRHRIVFYNSTVTDNTCTATGDDVTYMFSVWDATNRTYVFANSIVCTNKGFTYVIQATREQNANRITLNNVIVDYDPSPGYAQGNNWYQLTEDGRVRDKSENVIAGLEPIVFVEDSFLPDPNSITVNRGNNRLVPRDVTTDIAGNPRIVGTVDIGAFEGVFSIPQVAVTIEDDVFNHTDDFHEDGTINNISLREAFLYTNFFNVEKYQDYIVIDNLDSIDAIMRSFDRDNPDPGAVSPYFSTIEFAANVKNCTLTLGEPIEVHRDVTLVGKNRGGVDVTIDASANFAHVYNGDNPEHPEGEYFQIEHIDLLSPDLPIVTADWLLQHTNRLEDTARIFTVLGDASFTVNDITFKNSAQTTSLGGTGTSGGVFYVSENSTIEGQNLTFDGNSAAKYGGAIFNKGEVTLTGTTAFENNSAALGGAVYNRGTFTVAYDPTATEAADRESVTFEKNEAKGAVSNGSMANGSGAAIYNTSGATVNVSDATFDQNQADKYGGAISNFGTLNVANADFFDNTAATGGAIQSAGLATVDGAVFTGNSAVKSSVALSGDDFGGNGGAIFASKNGSNAEADANLTLRGTVEFTENAADNAGGALDFINGSLTFDSADMTFTDNTAGVVGGAIVVANDNITSTGSTYSASDNTSEFYAPTIAANCAFKSEAASNIKEAFGLITSAQRGTDAEYSIPRSEFDTFVRYQSAMSADSIIEFSYLAGMVETEPESITVYYNTTYVTIYPESTGGQSSVTLSELGINEPGTYAINFYINDVSQIAFTLNVSFEGDYCMMARLIDIADPHTAFTGIVGYTFKSYAPVAVSSWTISWGDGNQTTFDELGYYVNAYNWYDSEGDYQIDLSVKYADGTSKTFEAIATCSYREYVETTDSGAVLDDEVFLTDELFADEDSLFEIFN